MSTGCRMHGPDDETRIVAIMPCPPGWRLAHPPWSDDDPTVWTDPIAAFAQTENLSGLCAGCTCPQRRVTAMVAGEYGDLELAEDIDRVVPPGFVAEWSKDCGWALREIAPAVPPDAPNGGGA